MNSLEIETKKRGNFQDRVKFETSPPYTHTPPYTEWARTINRKRSMNLRNWKIITKDNIKRNPISNNNNNNSSGILFIITNCFIF